LLVRTEKGCLFREKIPDSPKTSSYRNASNRIGGGGGSKTLKKIVPKNVHVKTWLKGRRGQVSHRKAKRTENQKLN